MSEFKYIVDQLPYSPPFLFVDEITLLNEDQAEGHFTFSKKLDFYRGHFTDFPVTPGVILIETMAQIGLVSLGIFLIQAKPSDQLQVAFTSSEVEFLKPVLPGETVFVSSKKVYFRFNKLKCNVELTNQRGELVCKGILAGMIKKMDDE